jgi:hypothetical protein
MHGNIMLKLVPFLDLSESGNLDAKDKSDQSGYVWISWISSGRPEEIIWNQGYLPETLIL